MSKPEFKPVTPWQVPLEEVKSVAEERNIPTQVFPKAVAKPAPKTAKEVAPAAPTKTTKLSIDVSEDLLYAVKQRALEERRSVRSFVLSALDKAGITVSAEDVVDDGRKKQRNNF